MRREEREVRIVTIALLGTVVIGLTGCITDKMILTNDQGQTKTCEFTGHIGILSPIMVHERYKKCVDKAKADGFQETPDATPAS
jgi:hypothetical protein